MSATKIPIKAINRDINVTLCYFLCSCYGKPLFCGGGMIDRGVVDASRFLGELGIDGISGAPCALPGTMAPPDCVPGKKRLAPPLGFGDG